MAQSLSSLFNTPPEWANFGALLADIGEDPRIDAASVMERITPIFQDYENVTRPRSFRQRLGGKASPHYADYFVYCAGWRRGAFEHRVMRVTSQQHLQALDVNRMLSDAEIFKPSALQARINRGQSAPRDFGGQLEATLTRGLETVRRQLGHGAQWVDDIAFIYYAHTHSAKALAPARAAVADAMLTAVDDIVGSHRQRGVFLHRHFMQALDAFDEQREHDNNQLVAQARGGLDQSVLNTLLVNPTSMSTGHYQWLTRDKKTERLVYRRKLAQACPILLLTDGYQNTVKAYEEKGVPTGAAIASIFGCEPSRVPFYASLNESQVGADTARGLIGMMRFIERAGEAQKVKLGTPVEWQRAAQMVGGARETAKLLERDAGLVFNEFRQTPALVSDDSRERAQRLSDISVLKNRIAAFGLVPKLLTQAQIAGIQLPVVHALYMAAGDDLLGRDQVASIPTRLREAIDEARHGPRMINAVLKPAKMADLQREAFAYGTHLGEFDRKLRELIITNRLAEHAAEYPWAPLPIVEMREEGYTVVPLHSQADLLKNALNADNELWRRAPEAIVNGTHFVALRRRGGFTDATAVISEPEDPFDSWVVNDVIPSDTGRRRNNLREIVEAYVETPEFLDTVDLKQIRDTRARLYKTLSSRAHGHERIGLSDMRDMEERKMKLRLLASHWPLKADFDIDEFGCISTPAIDRMATDMIESVTGLYHAYRVKNGPRPKP